MQAEDQPPPPNQSLRRVGIGIGLLGVVFAIGLGALVFQTVRPRGEKVGVLNLTDPLATLVVNGKTGDSLVFRVDASVQVGALSLPSDGAIEQRASTQLKKSMLTVRAFAASGREHTATCPVYNGRAASTTHTSATFTRSGMLNDCVLALDQAGPWRVAGTVAWHPELRLSSATLEARLDASGR